MIYGYIRVSSKEQSKKRQEKELLDYGVKKENIYSEEVSGKNFEDRIEYPRLFKACSVGDTIVFTSLDRFSRNVSATVKELEELKKKGINAVFIKENIDTSRGEVNTLLITVFTWVAEQERKTLLERQRKGYNALQKTEDGRMISKKGTLIGGREKKLTNKQLELIKEYKKGNSIYNLSQLARLLNVSRPYLYKKLKEIENENN